MKHEISVLSQNGTYIKSYESNIVPIIGDEVTICDNNVTDTYKVIRRCFPTETGNHRVLIFVEKCNPIN